MAKPKTGSGQQKDSDLDVHNMYDRMTRSYLLTVISGDLIAEHRRNPVGHYSEPLSRLLAWCQRRPLPHKYAVKAEADGNFRIVSMTGRRGVRPIFVGEARFASLDEARHGVLLQHIADLTGK